MCAQSCLTRCDPMDYTHEDPLATELSRQEYCSGLPFPIPEDLLSQGIKPVSLASPALAGRFFTASTTQEALIPFYK